MDYIEMVQEPVTIVGISERIADVQKASDQIGKMWDEFLQNNYLEEIPNSFGNAIYAIYTDYDDDGAYTVILGAAVEDSSAVPEDMESFEIPGGNYASYQVNGSMPEALIDFWKIFNGSDLDYERALATDFEKWNIEQIYETPEQVEVFISKL